MNNKFLILSLVATFVSCQGVNKTSVKVDIDTVETPHQSMLSDSLVEENSIKADSQFVDTHSLERKNTTQPVAKVKSVTKKPIKPKELPIIVFEESNYEVGEIIEGDVIEHKFQFKNEGKVPLEIKKAEGTCGCTVPSFPFIAVAPGESGFIGVQYHSVGKSGIQRPEIVVTSNGKPSTITLTMDLNVVEKNAIETMQSDSLE